MNNDAFPKFCTPTEMVMRIMFSPTNNINNAFPEFFPHVKKGEFRNESFPETVILL